MPAGKYRIKCRFQSTLPRWSDHLQRLVQDNRNHFNPRSLAVATGPSPYAWFAVCISIHAPSRERPADICSLQMILKFQSTLPRGSDNDEILIAARPVDFNPRSLAGATSITLATEFAALISIHAPSRERPNYFLTRWWPQAISIHAPSRERLDIRGMIASTSIFQSTLPYGSDCNSFLTLTYDDISIHAPSRERLC